MDQSFNMVSPFSGVDWNTTTSPNFQPTSVSMNVPVPPSPTRNQQPTSTPSPHGFGSSDMASNPVVKFQVCSNCRRKKRKCSLDRPSCSLCLENGWVCEYRCLKRKPGPAKRSSSSTAAAPPFAAITPQSIISTTPSLTPNTPPTVGDYARSKLFDLYFNHIQVMFPMFCRRSFERDLAEGRIPNKLLYAMYAVSSRFAAPEETQNLLGHLGSNPWELFARIAERESQEQEDQNASISLNDIKTDILRTFYQFSNFPGRKAFMMAGTLVRMALAIGLHLVDCGVQNTNLTDFEMEEHRFVWWAVWKLDSAMNCLTGSPFGIDGQSMGTALTSTSITDFTAGNVVKSKLQLLPADSTKMWKIAKDLLTVDTEDGLNMYLLAVCHLRTITLCRQRLQVHTSAELTREYMVLRNTLFCQRLSLPEWYFDPSRHSELETSHAHRARLEALLVLHIAQIQCYLPLSIAKREDFIADDSISNWKMCVASEEDIAAIFHHWKPEYFCVADPFISGTLWFAIILLTLHTMLIHGQSEEASSVKISNALDLLSLALENFGRHWKFSRLLLDSVHHLQGWNWLKIDFPEVLSLLAQVRIPMNPLRPEPGSIDMWQIVGNINDILVEEVATDQYLE